MIKKEITLIDKIRRKMFEKILFLSSSVSASDRFLMKIDGNPRLITVERIVTAEIITE
jgi:hypothetical protein